MAMNTAPGRLGDPQRSSANPSEVAPEVAALHARLGKLVVNRFTYRLLRAFGGLLRPRFIADGVALEDVTAGRARMTIISPPQRRSAGAIVLFHGGGFVFGARQDIFPKAAHMAKALGVPVSCPSYGLAPQAPFPAALDDAHAAWHAVLARAGTLGIDPAKIIVGGYSAGGGLAASLVQRLHDEGGAQPAAQLLIYPMLDAATAGRAELDPLRHSVWSNASNRFAWGAYLRGLADPAQTPYAIPAACADLSGLPPAWVGVGTCDLFLDEDRAYAARLAAAGVPVTYEEVAGGIHAFDMDDNALGRAFTAAQIAFAREHVS